MVFHLGAEASSRAELFWSRRSFRPAGREEQDGESAAVRVLQHHPQPWGRMSGRTIPGWDTTPRLALAGGSAPPPTTELSPTIHVGFYDPLVLSNS